MDEEPLFQHRRDAGRRLARTLERFRQARPVVMALPRGGVEVGFEVASHLGAELHLIVGRKLGAPQQPEFAIGAIAPNGVVVVDTEAVSALGITSSELQRIAATEFAEMQRRMHLYQGEGDPPDLRGRAVLLIDDGLATGLTAVAAVRSLKAAGAGPIVVAVPVGSADARDALAREADEVVVLETPEPFGGVGAWYEDFSQVDDETVQRILRESTARSDAVSSA